MGTIFTEKYVALWKKKWISHVKSKSAWSCSRNQCTIRVSERKSLSYGPAVYWASPLIVQWPNKLSTIYVYNTKILLLAYVIYIYILITISIRPHKHIAQAHHFHATDKSRSSIEREIAEAQWYPSLGGPDSAMSSRPQRISRANYAQVSCFVYREVFEQFYC